MKTIDKFELVFIRGEKHLIRSDKVYGKSLEDFPKQIEYNLQNGRGVKVDNFLIEPTQYINNVEDLIKIFYKEENSVPILTNYLYGMISNHCDWISYDEVGIDGKRYKFNTKSKPLEGGLEVTEEQRTKIKELMQYLESKEI